MRVFKFCFSFLFYITAFTASSQGYIKIDSVPLKGLELSAKWKFHAGDDSAWASPSFDDSQWKEDSTTLMGNKGFKGIGWFRIHLRFDSSLDRVPLAFVMEQTGASSVYINGKSAMDFGTVSANERDEKKYNPQGFPLSFNHDHYHEAVIAIRYSNHELEYSFDNRGNKLNGFHAYLFESNYLTAEELNQNTVFATVSNFLFGFFIALGFAHLFVFFFYPKYRANLFYFIFILFLSHYILFLFFTTVVNSISLSSWYFFISFILFPFFFVSLLTLVYSVMSQKFTRFYWVMLGLALVTSVLELFEVRFGTYLLFTVAFACSIASIFVIARGIKQKQKGSGIISMGFFTFAAFIILVMAIVVTKGNVSIESGSWEGVFLMLACLLCIMSIPIFMSVYLAWDFARTSRDLGLKLIEVENLSAKTIEQEKEKQKILEMQKETLELQVQERTREISEQKKVIEEKNKDITDSINYAKRIQEAILPSRALKRELFPDSFVLFRPKDIVSGDFYYFAKAEGWSGRHEGNGAAKRIIAAVDCTGHGVPGALMSVIGNNILNQVILENGITRPAEILQRLDTGVRAVLKNNADETETRDGMDIALCCFDYLSSAGGKTRIEYAGAQRPLWIVRHEKKELEEIKSDKFSIGGLAMEAKKFFTNYEVELGKGDCVYIFSDGYADQFGGGEGKKFMSRRFKDLLLSIHHLPMNEQETILNETIEKWKASTVQVDDILVIGIRA